jgi:hypothetical protein
VTNTWVEHYYYDASQDYSNMPWISQSSGIGENATAGEALSLQITWNKDMRNHYGLKQEWSNDLNTNTYVADIAILHNGTYTHGQGAYDRIKLVMCTPADD